MLDEILAMRSRLLAATGLALVAGMTASCLDTVPEDECFERAEEDYDDDVITFSLQVEDGEDCPGENSKVVEDAALVALPSMCFPPETKVRYVACGPRQDGTSCRYVAKVDQTTDGGCLIGRPFMVAGRERVAQSHARTDWCGLAEGPAPAPTSTLDPQLRRQLAAYWVGAGLAEHASVAAFARFGLQLAQLGAPPRLLRACHRAMRDETRHAQLAFAQARRFGAGEPGPGSLDLRGALDSCTELESIVFDVVVEGCLGETRAAAEARTAARACADPSLRATLARVAVDEERHAALAWSFVAWVAERSPSSRAMLSRAFARALAQAWTPSDRLGEVDAEAAARWGLLGPEQRRQIDADVRAQLVEPLAASVVSGVREARV